MLIQVQKRYEYIDCMRGLTMLLVVYYHIIGQVLGMVDQSGLSNFCGGFRMPLFFFVSGFLAYTPSPNLGWLQKKNDKSVIKPVSTNSCYRRDIFTASFRRKVHFIHYKSFKIGFLVYDCTI